MLLMTAGNHFIQAQEEATNTGPKNKLLSRNNLQETKATCLKAFDPSSYRSQSRGQTSLFWDFEDESQLDDWTILDDDGDGYSWEYLNGDAIKSHSGTGVLSSASYDNSSYSALYPDNWLISPVVTLGGWLSFYACGQDPSYVAEVFAVYICIGNPQNSSDFVKISNDITVVGTMKQYNFDLRPYEGQSGCIAIRHYNVADMFRLNVDDISIGVEIPDNHETSAPEIIVEETDQDVIITATGEGLVTLYIDFPDFGTVDVYDYGSVAYWLPREEEDMYVEVWATLHDDYELIGESDHQCIQIPALEPEPGPDPDDPHSYGCWLVLYDKYGDEVWKEMSGEFWWDDEYYFELGDGLSLDLTTYSVIDYYTETDYKDVLGYVMINGVRYGPETPNLNVYSGQYEDFDFTSAYGVHLPLSPQEENCFAFYAGLSCTFFAVKDGELYVGEYPHTGLPVYDSWTSVIAIDKNGNQVEFRVGKDDINFSSDLFGSVEYNGLVPFYLKHYTIHEPYSSTPYDVIYSAGAEVDGTEAIFGVPYAQKLIEGNNHFLAPAGFSYVFGMFEDYLFALQVGKLGDYTDENTSFTVSKSSIPTGKYQTFRAQIGFKEEYADKVSDVRLIVKMPDSCPLYDNSVMVGEQILSNYSVESNKITIPLADHSAIVRFCAIPTEVGEYVAHARLMYNLDGETYQEEIGQASFNAFEMSLRVPPVTGNPTFTVSGTASNGTKVQVYVDDEEVAQTECLANGSWRVLCSLNEPANPSTHWVYAVVETTDGNVFWTDSKEVLYRMNVPQPDQITMINNSQNIVFDFVNGTTTPDQYSYNSSNSQFTFVAKLKGTTTSVRNLKIKVFDTSFKVTSFNGVYSASHGGWVCTASYPDYQKLPTSVGFEYDYVWEGISGHYENVFADCTNGVTPNAIPIIDPSGFVYEAVPSNRLEGVTTTAYYRDPENGETVLWDAEQFEQQNPLMTDANGYYRWDVPIGIWQVKYEKDGYQTVYSEWLPVPPPQLDVNIAMTEMLHPEVIKAHAYPNAVELEFSKYMKPETLTTSNITVSVNGTPVSGTIQLLNEEAGAGGQSFASKVRFNAAQPFNASKVTLRVNRGAESYAGLQMNNDCVIVLDVESEMTRIVTDATLDVAWSKSQELIVCVQPALAATGKTLTVGNSSQMIISTDAESYIFDENGQAVIKIQGDLPGVASLQFGIEGYDLTATTLVNVTIDSDTGLKGDVNGDGEVNIADVNAIIGIILGNNVDAEIGERADVNGDGEVNIADINSVISIILNPANQVMSILNCEDLLHLDNVTMNLGDMRTLNVKLNNAERYSALQCDIVLPEGLTLVNVDPVGSNERCIGEQDAKAVRALTYSMLKRPFDSPEVLNFTVRADAALDAESLILLTNVVIADCDNKAWRASDCIARVNAVSGIDDLTTTAARVWVEGRMLCIAADHEGVAQIYTVNGIMREMNVKNGVSRQDLEPGIYVVIVNGLSHKIYIR